MKTFAKIAAVISAVVVLLAIIVGVIWIATRPGYSAVAMLKVSHAPPSIAFQVDTGGEEVDFDIYRHTQMSAVKSIFVIQAALREPGIAQLPALAQQEHPVSWLQHNLEVTFPNNGEYMAIALSGDDPDELEQIVDAVKDAYYEEVVLKERREKQIRFDQLGRVVQQTREEIREEAEKFRDLAASLGSAQSETAETSRTLAFRELEMLRAQRHEIMSNLWDAKLAMHINQLRQEQLDATLHDDTVQEMDEAEDSADAAPQELQVEADEGSALESDDD